MTRNTLCSSAIAFVLLASAISSIAAADEEGRFFEGNIALYPKPEAVEVVQPKGEIEPDPTTSAIAGSGVTQGE